MRRPDGMVVKPDSFRIEWKNASLIACFSTSICLGIPTGAEGFLPGRGEPTFLPKEMSARMILPPSTLETIHAITGEEPMPRHPALRRAVSLIYAVDPTIWARRVDLCLVGGDPLVLSARLKRICDAGELGPHQKLAIIDPGLFSGAPIASLGDPAVRAEFETCGAVPSAPPEGGLSRFIASMVDGAVQRLHARGPRVIYAVDQVQGARDALRGEIVLRLTRDAEARRAGRAQRAPASRGVNMVATGAHSAGLFETSRSLSDAGMARLRTGLLEFAAVPPSGARFADILVARRVEVLSGFISPGDVPPSVRFDESFVEEEIGADVFRLARRVPNSLEDAISAWRADLLRAARGKVDPIT